MRMRYALLVVILLVAASCSWKGAVIGLKPEFPENRIHGLSKDDISDKIVFVKIDSLQPTLRWESFPRPQDLKADKEGKLRLIKNVAYDLKIWSSESDFPNVVICSKQGLREPYYTLEIPLEPCSKYFWTIRARFKLNDKLRVTEWGISKWPRLKHIDFANQNSFVISGDRSPIVPNPNLYRFKTPCPAGHAAKNETIR